MHPDPTTPFVTRQLRRALAVAAAILAIGCGAAPAAPPAPAADAAPEPPAPATPLTGALSEEAFKALHELTGEKAPPARGQTIDLAGERAYLSLPEGAAAPLPAIVVIHEWWGLNEHIMHWTDRLAEDGYAALAVDLYGGKVATTPDEAMALMKAVDEAKALATLQAAHRYLGADARIAAPRTGSIGWCFGGGWSLQLALHEPDLDAAVIYYGRLVQDVDQLKAIRAPVLGIFGNLDQGIPPEAVNAFDKALTEAGVEHTILRYDANHAFANPSGARYDQAAAADAWAHVRKFFAEKLKGG